MKISAPNYTQTPNSCFDEMFKALKEGELRVVLVLIRQTFGWHKSADRISLGQIARKSGMEKSSVCKSLKTLIEKDLVTKKKFGDPGKERCYYSLILEQNPEEDFDDEPMCDEERELISNNYYQCSKNTPPVFESHNPQCSKNTHKINSSKETIQKQQQAKPDSVAAVSSKDENKSLEICKEASDSKYFYNKTQATNSKQVVKTQHNVYYKALSISTLEPRPFQIYSCLLSLNLTEEEKIAITKSNTEDRIANAVEIVKSKKNPPKNLVGFIIWAAAQNLKAFSEEKIDIKNKSYDGLNRSYWRSILNAFCQLNQKIEKYGMREGNEYVQISSEKIYFRDFSFLEMVENFFRKNGILVGGFASYIKQLRQDFMMQCA